MRAVRQPVTPTAGAELHQTTTFLPGTYSVLTANDEQAILRVRGDDVTLILRSQKSSAQGHAPAVYWVEVKADLPGDAPISRGGDGGAAAGGVEP